MSEMTESEFLINMAISKFNSQYNTALNPLNYNIKTIPKNRTHDIGYQIETNSLSDNFIMRIYLNIENNDSLADFRLQLDSSINVNQLGDELYVAFGTVDEYYTISKGYTFTDLDTSIYNLDVFVDDSGYALDAGGGDYLGW